MKDFLKKLKKKISEGNALIFLSALFALFVVVFVLDIYFRVWISENSVLQPPLKQISLNSYPKLAKQLDPDISAEAAVVMDDSSKTIVFSKNENLRFSMASTTKIMTALVALDYFNPSDILTVYSGNVEPVVVGFTLGEKLNFMDVLYAMLLPSGNDAALMIAQNYPGGERMFIKKMNEKAKEFKLLNTHFADSSGLSDDNFSTPLDLAKLTSSALKNKTFAQIVSTKEKTISDASGKKTYHLLSLDKLLGKEGITGVKTGYTQEAGGVLITSKEENGKRFIIIVMKSEDRFSDIEKILSQIEGAVTFLPIHP